MEEREERINVSIENVNNLLLLPKSSLSLVSPLITFIMQLSLHFFQYALLSLSPNIEGRNGKKILITDSQLTVKCFLKKRVFGG